MLVLTRAVGEEILIGDDIIIKVTGVRDDKKIRIGIQAPPDVPVHRREVYEAIRRGMDKPPAKE